MNLPDSFYIAPAVANMTVRTKELQELLLNTEGWVIARGRMWEIKHKSIGPGIYRVSLKQKDN